MTTDDDDDDDDERVGDMALMTMDPKRENQAAVGNSPKQIETSNAEKSLYTHTHRHNPRSVCTFTIL